MRNFLILVRKYWNVILFLILEIICFRMIAKSRSMQGLDIINSANAVVGYVYTKQNNIAYYFQLRRMNDSLLVENTRLRNTLALNTDVDTFTTVIAKIPVTIKDTTKRATDTAKNTTSTATNTASSITLSPTNITKVVRYGEYQYIPARVINNTTIGDRLNYITINRGAKDGIKKEMAVVTTNGIVGKVASVSDHFASVVSVLSTTDRKVSTKLADGTSGLFTIWTTGNPDYMVTERVPIYNTVKKGDSVFTTSYSVFPENILIGTVVKIDTMKATNAKNLKIKLSTNFRNLQYVYVVSNKFDAERKNLEQQSSSSKK
jgi:rod shape-determining protein MreC